MFVVSFLILGYLGVVPITVWGQFADGWPLLGAADRATVVARVLTVIYFLFFLLMPWYTARDKTQAGAGEGDRMMRALRSLHASCCRCAARAVRRRAARRAAPISGWSPRRSIASTSRRCSAARGSSSTTASTATRAKYMRYNRLTDLGLTEAQIRDNLMFADRQDRRHDDVAMRPADAKAWFGVAAAGPHRSRRACAARDWLYNYLLALLPGRHGPSGWNNLVFPNVAMPHVLCGAVGQRPARDDGVRGPREAQAAAIAAKGSSWSSRQDDTYVVQTIAAETPGTMSRVEYQRMVADLVNFLDYMGEPAQEPADDARPRRAPLPRRAVRLRVLAETRVLEGRSLNALRRPSTAALTGSPHVPCSAPMPPNRAARSLTREENLPMMTLYSGTTDPFSQRCRIVLHEKGMDFQIIDVDLDHKPEDLAVMNPYNQVPVLVERDLVLHESNIINEYIDERFPHPQLMPADPVMRARARLFLHPLREGAVQPHRRARGQQPEARRKGARATSATA